MTRELSVAEAAALARAEARWLDQARARLRGVARGVARRPHRSRTEPSR